MPLWFSQMYQVRQYLNRCYAKSKSTENCAETYSSDQFWYLYNSNLLQEVIQLKLDETLMVN
jgi:hypothetical protein